MFFFFFFNDTATTEIYTLSLHDALPIYEFRRRQVVRNEQVRRAVPLLEVEHELEHPGPDGHVEHRDGLVGDDQLRLEDQDRKSTRLNSSHGYISYAVFCLKKKNKLAQRI